MKEVSAKTGRKTQESTGQNPVEELLSARQRKREARRRAELKEWLEVVNRASPWGRK